MTSLKQVDHGGLYSVPFRQNRLPETVRISPHAVLQAAEAALIIVQKSDYLGEVDVLRV